MIVIPKAIFSVSSDHRKFFGEDRLKFLQNINTLSKTFHNGLSHPASLPLIATILSLLTPQLDTEHPGTTGALAALGALPNAEQNRTCCMASTMHHSENR